MTGLLPDPVPLDPPPGDPRALEDLAGRLVRAAELLGALGERLAGDAAAAPSWAGRDAEAATARVHRAAGLAGEAADALVRAGGRVARHGELVEEARRRLTRLRVAQEEDYGAAAARLGGVVDPAAGPAGPLEELRAGESARRLAAAAIRAEVAEDAAGTAAVLAACSAVTGGAGRTDGAAAAAEHLAGLLPGWHEVRLGQRGRELADVLRAGDDVALETAARELLPVAGEGVVAAALLTALGADGLRDVLRRLGDGTLSSGSATARVVATALGAPVAPADATAVARIRDARHVDPGDHRSTAADLVALGMGVVLAAGRGNPSAGPPAATVRGWGRQVIARERAMGGERIVDRVRLPPSPSRPGDPLEEVLARLASAGDPAPAADLLRGQPTWSHLLARPWDDGGAALGALAARAGEEGAGAVGAAAVRSGLRAMAAGLGDDGDPAGSTVDPATAAVIAPGLAEAVATRPHVVVDPLAQAVAQEGRGDRLLLRGLGRLSSEPTAAAVLDRGLAGVAPAVAAGWTAVREYGQRLAHALDEFAAQEQAELRGRVTGAATDLLSSASAPGRAVGALVEVGAVLVDLDGTWEESPDRGARFTAADAVRAAGGDPAGERAYRDVTGLLGTPVAPGSPPVDWAGVVTALVPGRGRHGDAVGWVVDGVVDGVGAPVDDDEDAGTP